MGGRRKSKRKAPTRKVAAPLDQVFTCPICHEEKAVRCTLDSKAKQGTVACTKCNRSHSYRITALSRAVDVYGEWIDDLTAKYKDHQRQREQLAHGRPGSQPSTGRGGGGGASSSSSAATRPLGSLGSSSLGKRRLHEEEDEEDINDIIDDSEQPEDEEEDYDE